MPRRPRPLPPALTGTVFTRAAGVDHGETIRRLRAHDLDRRVHGVRAPAGSTDDRRTRALAFQLRLGDQMFFSHSTAALLWGAPLPPRFERISALHVSVEAPQRAPHAAGLIGHSRRVVPGDVVVLDGLRVSSPARTWCEMASALDLADMVAVADYFLHHRRGLLTWEQLTQRLDARDRISRHRVLGAALQLTSDRSESRPESRLRVCCMLAGLPRVSVNHELTDVVTGRSMRLDLAWPEVKFAIEYQGDVHRTPGQWRRDMTRRENLRLAGWRILELNADDLRDTAALIARIRAGMASTSR